MEKQLSDILDNILGLLLLEGSYEIDETEDNMMVTIETPEAGRLIGFRGESLTALQLIVNQILSKQSEQFKRVVIDIGNWRKQKEEELAQRSRGWAKEVLESGKEMELEPMPSWQRRIIHMAVSEIDGIESESIGEGRLRHLVIKAKAKE